MNNIKKRGICKRVIFRNHPFYISVFEDENGDEFTLKANFLPRENSPYNIIAIKDEKTNYENTYKCVSISYDIDLSKVSDKDLISFLSTFTSERNAKNIVETLENPIEVLEGRDIDKLTTVKGVGRVTAEKIFDGYIENKDNSADVLMLIDYGFSDELVKKLLSHYGSGQAVVDVIEEDVYQLTKVKGIGFKKADLIFLKNLKGSPSDPRRARAYVEYFFNKKYQEGYTWISPSDFVKDFKENMPLANIQETIEHINESEKYEMRVDENGDKRLSLSRVSDIERSVAKHIYRLSKAKSNVINNDLDEVVEKLEEKQGWKYDQSQREAIRAIEENNVILIQGLAGTGKSTIINAYTKAAQGNTYTIKQCALSGKAANNLATITGISSETIHSTLGTDFVNGGFVFKENNPMFVDVVVLDEISMVSLEIFESLIQAIPTGSKLIMLGDNGQLDSIGAGVMKPIANSGYVKTVTLTNIHRQAQKSAVITHSLAFRQGVIPKELSLKPMTSNVYGENKDLRYTILPDGETKEERDKINSQVLIGVGEMYRGLINQYDVKDVQIITQTISNGMGAANDLNAVAQNIYNPKSDGDVTWVKKGNGFEYEFRVGDRVINGANNRSVTDVDGNNAAIFNGSMGTIIEIDKNNSMTVDFDNIGEIVMYNRDISNLSLGYAITAHKSQGSTLPVLIFVLSHHYMMNSQEMLYTGITRTGTKCMVLTTPKAIRRCVKNTSGVDKNSNLTLYLRDIYNKMEE